MAGENSVKELVTRLSKLGILVAADVSSENLDGFSVEDIISRVIERKVSDSKMDIIAASDIRNIISEMQAEKTPKPVEIIQKPEYRAYASEIEANYTINNKPPAFSNGTVDEFVSHFRDRIHKLKSVIEQHRGSMGGIISNLESLNAYSNGRDVTVIGIVSNKITTKKGNIMVVIEDETAESKIIFMNGMSQQAKQLFEKARHIVNDEVIAIKGKLSNPFVMAKEIVWPDVPILERKQSEEDIAITFISDVHIGSKLLMEKNFTNFIKWINGDYAERSDLASKVKYLVIGGDVVDGIGVYPNHDKDLAIPDIYAQYKMFFNFISKIPEYINIFIIPGNHDAVQRAEPQPQIGSDMLGDFKSDNVHILPNPSFLTLHGTHVLTYHGTSLDSVIRAIPGTTYANPEKAMIEVLKRRHLSPIWGGNIIVPSKNDELVIDKVPDILHMGHVHKNCLANYHGVDIINSGTWQATTEFQLMQGHVPSPCIVPVYEAKANRFVNINFNK